MAKRASGNYLLRLSVTLMVIGYGSVLLSYTDIQFTLLMWANSLQPWIGLIVGTIGLGILVVPMILARRAGGGSVAPAQSFQQNYGYAQPPQQSYGPPAQAFPQQAVPQPGFPQQGAPQGYLPQGFPQQQPFPQQPFPQQQPGVPPRQPGPPQQFPPQGYGPQQ